MVNFLNLKIKDIYYRLV